MSLFLKVPNLTQKKSWPLKCTSSQQTLTNYYTSPHITQNTLLRAYFSPKKLGSTEYVTTQVTLIMHATFSFEPLNTEVFEVPKNNEKRNIVKTSTKWQIF